MKNRLKLLIFLVVSLFLIISSQSFSEEETFKPKSERRALDLSVMGTFLPVAAGWTILVLNDTDEEPPLAIGLIIGGTVVGPSLGYLYGAPTLGNMKGFLIRSTVVGLAIWIWHEIELNDKRDCFSCYDTSDWNRFFLILFSSSAVLISGITDIVKVKNKVREHNRKLLFKNSCIITPKYFAESQAWGLGIEVKF